MNTPMSVPPEELEAIIDTSSLVGEVSPDEWARLFDDAMAVMSARLVSPTIAVEQLCEGKVRITGMCERLPK